MDTNKAMPGGGQVQYTCPAVFRLNNMPTTKLTRNNQPHITCLVYKLINLIKTELGLDFGWALVSSFPSMMMFGRATLLKYKRHHLYQITRFHGWNNSYPAVTQERSYMHLFTYLTAERSNLQPIGLAKPKSLYFRLFACPFFGLSD